MSRPKTKDELVKLSHNNFNQLNDFIDSLEDQMAQFPEGTLNRNVMDVLAHLHHWHIMMLSWYEVGMQGQKPEMPAKSYTWKTLPDLNREIWQKYRNIELDKVRQMLTSSFNELQDIIRKHSNEELFEKKRYKWTGTTSLGAYLVSATSSHYDWAYKLIKKARK